jgi:hypothetical protein
MTLNVQNFLDELQREQQRIQRDLNASKDVSQMGDLTKELSIVTQAIATLIRLRNHRKKVEMKELNKN